MTASSDLVAAAVGDWLAGADRPLVLGICGAQGSGKSTLAGKLEERLTRRGLRTASLSLDDLYLGTAARRELASSIHPLFATRGVPGTHDVGLGLSVIKALREGEAVPLPRFDKAIDEPLAQTSWPLCPKGTDVLIFEGWCVGARPQDEAALVRPVNSLEREEDANGRWRKAVNDYLSVPYQSLFGQIDRLVLLAAPGFEVVEGWRRQQEHDLRRKLSAEGRDPDIAMTDTQIARFIGHYERITRHVLETMPAYADLTITLDASRQVTRVGSLTGLSSR